MKKTPQLDTFGFKILALLGLLGIPTVLLAIVAVVFFASKQMPRWPEHMNPPVQDAVRHQDPALPAPDKIGLLGSICGGSLHLPCGSGMACKIPNGSDEGVCVVTPTSAPVTHVQGDVCDEADGDLCDPSFYCHAADGKMTCATKDANAPHILSAKFDGLQPGDDGVMRAPGKTKVQAQITAVNAKKASLLLIPDFGPITTLGMTAASAGVYQANIDLPTKFAGRVVVVVTSKDGSTNSLAKQVVTVE